MIVYVIISVCMMQIGAKKIESPTNKMILYGLIALSLQVKRHSKIYENLQVFYLLQSILYLG